jgi:hypothetical protein
MAPAQAPGQSIDEVKTISSGAAPTERSFEVTAPGTHVVELTDVGVPAALAGIKLAVTFGTTVVVTQDGPGSKTFDAATSGSYVVRVVPKPGDAARAGSFGVVVRRAAATAPLLQFTSSASLPPPAIPDNRVIVDTGFPIAAAGTYQVTLADLALPQALTSVSLALTRGGAAALAARLDAPGTATFTVASAGDYRLFAVGDAAASANGGLFAIRVVAQSSGQPVFELTSPIGRTVAIGSAALTAGGHSLLLRDLGFPAALSQRSAVVIRDATVVARATAAGSVPFTAPSGSHQLFAYATPAATPGVGSFEVELRRDGGAAALSEIRTVSAGASAPASFTFPIDVGAAGAYRARLADFEFRAPLASVSMALWQNGASLGTITVPGNLDANLVAGRAFVLVAARPTAGGGGLFGLDVRSTATGGPVLFEGTQGVGALFSARKFSVLGVARYSAVVSDLGFPAAFADLSAIVTTGTQRVGSIFGSGTFNFDASAGNYFVNLIAQPGASELAGTYGLQLRDAPPLPTLTLTASAASVALGGTVDLTWTSQGATTCTARNGWTGAKALSGRERSPAVNAATTFVLDCDGAGGRGTAQVTVDVTTTPVAQGGGGGGGALGGVGLLLLMAGCLVRATPRFAQSIRRYMNRDGALSTPFAAMANIRKK